MSALATLVAAFARADVGAWTGLPAGTRLDDLAGALVLDPELTGTDLLGDDLVAGSWVAAESEAYEGGLRVWADGDAVVLLEGRDPVDVAGEPVRAPDLGPPELVLDTVLGRLVVPAGEHVHAGRGLAVRTNPANGLLLGVLGFAPTTAADYRTRLRPRLAPRRLLVRARR